jgi:molybdate transport system substrate-binding protein
MRAMRIGVMRGLVGAAVLALALPAAPAGQAEAADIKVLSAGAVRAIVTELTPSFEKETGHKVAFEFGTAGQTRQRLASEPADVVILPDTGLDEQIKQDRVVAGSRADIARTGMGVGVREGAPKPDISTTEALKKALLAAKSITYVDPSQGATSGVYFSGLLQRWGIADAMKPKTTLVSGGYPAERVAKGEVELVVHQISEIMPVKGVTVVGPLPKDIQKVTTYSAGLVAKAAQPDAARAFIAYLMSAAVRPKFAAAGLDYKE